MKYAIIGGEKTEAMPKARAECPSCGKKVIAKCGNFNIWHWSHFPEKHCDSWWENETEWHRMWKSHFPLANQEVIQFDENSGEKHIADIKTDTGLVIEFQNSPMKVEELLKREAFYRNMIWIVNGTGFSKNFHISKYRLPPPDSDLAKDLDILRVPEYLETEDDFKPPVIVKKSSGVKGSWGTYYDLAGVIKGAGSYNRSKDVLAEIDKEYKGHHFFYWKKKRELWFNSTKPVFIDLGVSVIFHIRPFNKDHFCLQGIDKNALIQAFGGQPRKAATAPI